MCLKIQIKVRENKIKQKRNKINVKSYTDKLWMQKTYKQFVEIVAYNNNCNRESS